MKTLTISLLVLSSIGFGISAQARYMRCGSTEFSDEETFGLGFADMTSQLILVEQTWFLNGVRVGGVNYGDIAAVSPNWPLGTYSGNSRKRALVLSIQERTGETRFTGSATDFDLVTGTMRAFGVDCTLN